MSTSLESLLAQHGFEKDVGLDVVSDVVFLCTCTHAHATCVGQGVCVW